MKGDFTRFTHDPKKHYSGVLKQQGRVDVDADWNEYVQIQDYINQTETKDVIGLCGVPNIKSCGFQIISRDGTLKICAGRIYVDGILCELDENEILLKPAKEGRIRLDGIPRELAERGNRLVSRIYLAYLDVWQRHITAVEEPDLPEVALGGPDTTTRVKTEWQVRLKNITEEVKDKKLDCTPYCCGKWKPEEYESTGKLAARAAKAEAEENLCEVPAEAGYRGLENRLYRVEIHDAVKDTDATFKWSRDNGSVVFPIQKFEVQGGKSIITLKQLGKDEVFTLHADDWVEILGDETELALEPGTMAQVASESDGTDLKKGIVVLKTDVSKHKNQTHAKIRRWDQKATSVIKVATENWIPLEDGVEVCFRSGTYQTGDYWLIPARTKLGDVLWPKSGEGPEFQSRHGIQHHYCALALVRFNGEEWKDIEDCRPVFAPLTELIRFFYVGGDGQETIPDKPLPQYLQVGVMNGIQPVKYARVRFKATSGKVASDMSKVDDAKTDTAEVETGSDGVASCAWSPFPYIDISKIPKTSEQLEATLLDGAGNATSHPPIRFTANLSAAGEVAYDPTKCRNLKDKKTVQDAIDTLCQIPATAAATTGEVTITIPRATVAPIYTACLPSPFTCTVSKYIVHGLATELPPCIILGLVTTKENTIIMEQDFFTQQRLALILRDNYTDYCEETVPQVYFGAIAVTKDKFDIIAINMNPGQTEEKIKIRWWAIPAGQTIEQPQTALQQWANIRNTFVGDRVVSEIMRDLSVTDEEASGITARIMETISRAEPDMTLAQISAAIHEEQGKVEPLLLGLEAEKLLIVKVRGRSRRYALP